MLVFLSMRCQRKVPVNMPAVKLYANLRKLAGTKQLSITGTTIEAVLNELGQQHPPLRDVILENGILRGHMILTLNGQNIIDLRTSVTEHDVIAIFPPIAGGTLPLTLYEAPCAAPARREGSRRNHGWLV